jgi:hypothetical protein
MQIPFQHSQSAHCETGVMANLLSHYGLTLSEAMVFGIGSGLFFGYFPFIRLNHLPLTAFRITTGGIMKRVVKRLGVQIKWEKFRNPQKAGEALDEKLKQQTPVGCRTGAYWLTYFPRRYRFHFNMHNLVVYGKSGGEYLISDPVLPEPVRCAEEDLMKARFAKGPLPPKGRMYYIVGMPEQVDLPQAINKGITEVCRTMLKAPGPFLGVKGIRYLAGRLEKWPQKLGDPKAGLYLGQVIRMQEEIGTGGAGFRFIYAAFLQEAGDVLGNDQFFELSDRMTQIGDRWREFAVMASRNCKNRASDAESYPIMSNILRECADHEEALLKDLRDAISSK